MRKYRVMVVIAVAGLLSVAAMGIAISRSGPGQAVAIEATVIPDDAIPVPTDVASNYKYIEEPAEIYPADGMPAVAVPDGSDSITADAVRAYLADHAFPYAAEPTNQPSIASIDFMPAAEASDLIQGSLVVPKGTLVCVVALDGDFRVETGAKPFIGTKGYWVFVAGTGNLINESVLP